ncbi:PREDICTED: short/branched chain specific acyl-CoA dehydrogenase, mitochondrial [Ceratosolen solmsi marchali]|uniref:Short/branched chain specific acyl-CoA dehydrogenase, mitochondrial n=1 Tax=Ceratosolen solmsi marchali TaxID=326594 RepID=A0AAJ7DZK0_9HYME|nr:PREDICTED: short/branched chain specific acyl-CoA dehydrogenase, mitochondrial [Ceratosolen solmsi marchali]XP_011502200.1 PREDICTED: short/branched chain specific acyl-CoA dehydrogenase, mitochondrial [Ceratosolen solmsi marchali]
MKGALSPMWRVARRTLQVRDLHLGSALYQGHLPLSFLTEDEQMMKATVAKLAREEIQPLVRKMEKENRIDRGLLRKLFENGLMGLEVPVEYEGTGCSFLTTILAVEEVSKVDGAVGALVDVHNTLVNSLIKKVANEEQKKKYLPKLSNEYAGSFCLTEPSSGSDAFGLKTIAKKDGSDYIINGSKMWITNSDIAGVFLVFANADPSAGYRGITTFFVEREMSGLTVAKPEDKLGIKASGTCMVHFENVRVPESNILGEFGKGYQYAAGFLNEGRVGIGAQMIGIAQGALDATIPYTLERKQFGKQIFEFQSMQHQIAHAVTEVECARLLVYNAARLVEAKKDVKKEAAMAKYYASEVAQRVTSKCVDFMGGVGFTTDYPQEKFYRDSKIGTIYEGTSNMQLSTIAKAIKKEYT